MQSKLSLVRELRRQRGEPSRQIARITMSPAIAARRRTHGTRLMHAGVLLLCACLAACTSGDGELPSPAGGQTTDPVVLDFPIAYVKRPVPVGSALSPDARRLLMTQPGADLYLRDRASPSSAERNLTAAITLGAGDVRDVEPSYDGRKLLFAMREPLDAGADPVDPPTWNIWEYDLDHAGRCGGSSRRTSSPTRATTLRLTICPTDASFFRRHGSGNRKPSCSTRASHSSRRWTKAAANPRSCCMS